MTIIQKAEKYAETHCYIEPKYAYLTGYTDGYANAMEIKHIPSDKMIKKILDLAWEYAASDVEVNNLTEEGEFQYVKEHLLDN